jgi:hypothetical protein
LYNKLKNLPECQDINEELSKVQTAINEAAKENQETNGGMKTVET